jgi:hypothetical protein
MAKQWINLGGGPSIGMVTVDESNIRGEGGPRLPQLVLPLNIAMDPQEPAKPLGVLQTQASLFYDQQTQPASLVCRPLIIGQTGGPLAWSMSNGKTGSENRELRFFLNAAEVEALEGRRHLNASDRFSLFLALEPTVAGLQYFNEQQPGEGTQTGPWDDIRFGIYSQAFVFWTATVQTLFLNIERTTWIERVLPGLGYDRSRLIEAKFPPPLPNHGSAVAEFDRAKKALDERRYVDCVAACRGLIGIWETTLGATRQERIAKIVATKLGWNETDLRRRFIDDLWKAANDISNVAHHPEGQPLAPQPVGPADARLLFLVVAGLSEYLGSI